MPTPLEKRVALLEEQMAVLLAAGKRTSECAKGNDPETCSAASPYRYQKGCGGVSCRRVNTEYYSAAAKAARAAGTSVAAPRRRTSKIIEAGVPKRKKVWGAASTEG